MSSRQKLLTNLIVLCVCIGSAVVSCSKAGATADSGCIAPGNPGGGWDLTCRMTADALQKPGAAPSARPMRVTNLMGRGGAAAFSKVVTNMVANEDVIVAASPSTLLGLAENHYGAVDDRSVRWVAAVGAEPSVIAVSQKARWKTLGDFTEELREHPERILSGGASVVGGQDHMKMLLLARAIGLDPRRVRYVPLSGPIEAINAVLADSIQVFPGDASEVQRRVQAKQLRVLAVLANARATGVLADVPTAHEQGVDVNWVVWRGFYAPPGITAAAYDRWVQQLTHMAASPEWKAQLERNGLSPFFIAGKPFEESVHKQTEAYRSLSKEIGIIE